ncbi:MAG TPA: endonuclease domain-containing protein [Candidatus Andersenbacteria bacterium]|nr:endonuclease domain-containing protein [Candidatus Andersenbacteria bacterium]
MGVILFNKPTTLLKRRSLRKTSPEPENRLWYYIRNKNIKNTKFRRQYAIGPYITDFYCVELKLVIEIDGDSHFTDEAQAYDKERTEYFNECEIRVLRFTNTEVMKNINEVLERISEVTNT